MTRRTAKKPWTMLVAAPLMGCIQDAWNDWTALSAAEPSTGVGSSGSTAGLDDEPTGAVQTVTSASSTATAGPDKSTTGEPNDGKLEIGLSFDPPKLTKPGQSSAVLQASDNVTSTTLYLGGKVVAQGPPDALTYTFDALSEAANGKHDFTLLALDGKGGSVETPATLEVELPKHGTVKCPYQDKVGSQHSAIASVVFAEKYIVALGTRDEGEGSRLSLWLIDPEACDFYYQRSIDMWTLLPGVESLPSAGASLARDESGNFVIAGNLLVGADPKPYVALLRSDGSLIWETTGELGDEAAGVTRVPWPYEHIVMVGSRRTSKNPVRYDGLVKGYTTTGVVWEDVLGAPFMADGEDPDDVNVRSEKLLAVDVNPDTLEVLVVGEREFQPDQPQPVAFQRTFTARYDPLGGRLATWTSTGDYFPHDSARSLRWCGDGFIAGGWTRDLGIDTKPLPLVRHLDDEGKSIGRRAEALAGTTIFGIDCDREEKVVSAGKRDDGFETDALLYATALPDQPPVWQAVHDGQGQANDGATAVDCDAWGYCAWGGYEFFDGKTRAIVQIHYP